jgi:SAM-dependent methyltransferase
MDQTPLYQLNPTNRFTDRAAEYVNYRPTYPAAAIAAICRDHPQTIADIGAGTGISSRLLADHGQVWAVEPNAAMAQAAIPHPQITPWAGTAEQTGLPAASMDLVTAFQAFHWFKHDEALPELRRILRPTGKLAVIWNNRDRQDEFTRCYGQVLKNLSAKPTGIERMNDATPLLQDTRSFGAVTAIAFPHAQTLDLAGLIGLAMSRSYTPRTGAAHRQLRAQLTALHSEFATAGQVEMMYTTNIFLASPRD